MDGTDEGHQDAERGIRNNDDSEEWEGHGIEPEAVVNIHSLGVSSSRTLGSPRKRRTASGTYIYIANPSSFRKSYQASTRPRQPVEMPPLFDEEDIKFAFHTGMRSTLRYILDVIVTVLYWVQKPLSWAIAVLIILYLMSYLGPPLLFCLRPICALPVISRSELCTSFFPPPFYAVDPTSTASGGTNKKIQRADYFQIMDLEAQTFEKLLDDVIGGSALALQIRKAELVVTDLITLVKFSDLTTRGSLVDALEAFVNQAKGTARSLQKLDTKVIGALDSVSHMNEYALRLIEATALPPSSNSLSPMRIINLLGVASTSPSQKAAVIATFEQTMTMLAGTFQRLILQAETAQQNLEILEERSQILHEVLSREVQLQEGARQDVLDLFWTRLGFNRRKLRKFEAHFALLRHVGAYRAQALAHVVASLHALQEMRDGMEDLRDRVAAPELVGTEIPLEIHVQSIKAGLNRLKQGGLRAGQKRMAVQDSLSDSETTVTLDKVMTPMINL